MNTQKQLQNLKQSIALAKMVSEMTKEQKLECASIIKECDISRLLSNRTINQELKSTALKQKGKIKRFLNALGSHKDAENGVNVLFKKWSEDVTNQSLS